MSDGELQPFFQRLRELTPARIGLARSGVSIATKDHLAFQLAHAQARDAVHEALDVTAMMHALSTRALDALVVQSQAADRATYLARPDLGRRLNEPSRVALTSREAGCDVAIVMADGLSARAIATHAIPVLERLLPKLRERGRTIGPIVVAEQGRVALGDEIGETLRADLVCLLIGERPGLSSPDSLGIYLTWRPRIGRTDAERNCLSNIRPQGLGYDEATARCFWLIDEAGRRGGTGIALKDLSDAANPLTSIAPQVLPGS